MTRLPLVLGLVALVACGGDGEDTSPDTDTTPDCTDADGDGVCAEDDCDDDNPDIYPGAREFPYDDVDQDCDGEDLTDFDGDGFDGEVVGGDDCNDSNPEVYPGAPEICYGTLDMNCDGFIPEDDCDQDGFGRRSDCDDENPDINPGAEEIWYDGIDQDCGFESDFDRDGDIDEIPWDEVDAASLPERLIVWDQDELRAGRLIFKYITREEAADYWTGLDCDDTDAEVGGNLPEQWDGVDRNCDDVVDHLNERDALSQWLATGGVFDNAIGSQVVGLPDVDGDGVNEIVITDQSARIGDAEMVARGRAYILPWNAENGRASERAIANIEDPSGVGAYFGFAAARLRDVNGDGLDEIMIGNPFLNETGGVHVFGGATLGGGGELALAADFAVLTAGNLTGGAVASMGDLDGDGLDDAVVGSSYVNGIFTAASKRIDVAVFSGADIAEGGRLGGTDSLALLGGEPWGGGMAAGVDLDADGLPDLVLSRSDGTTAEMGGVNCDGGGWDLFVATGDDLRTSVILSLDDLDAITGESCEGLTLGVLDDINEDGYGEIISARPSADGADGIENGGEATIIDGSLLFGGSPTALTVADLASATITSANGQSWLSVDDRSGDVDGDGVEDVFVARSGMLDTLHAKINLIPPAGESAVYGFTGPEVAAGGTFTTDDADVRFFHRTAGVGFGASYDIFDLDDDGLDDIIISATMEGLGSVYTYRSQLGTAE
jgi:hypothetical protein